MRLTAFALAAALLAAPALAEAPFPDYQVVPLTKADMDFYMDVLRAAAAHNARLAGDDKAAVALSIAAQRHPPDMTHMTTGQMVRNANLMARAAELASYDEKIAEQRGMPKRYDALKSVIESALAQITGMGGSCGGDCSPPGGFSKAVLDRAKKEQAAINADKPLIQPHVAEIQSLKKQIGGFMFGGQ